MNKDRIYEEYEKLLLDLERPLYLYSYTEDSVEAEISKSLEDILKSLALKEINMEMDIRIFWISDHTVNASVTKIENTYCIGLFNGVITSLKYHIEVYYFYGVEDIVSNFLLPKNLYYRVMKDESDNGKLGNYIFTMAFFYIVMHEFGHILCGHVDKKLNACINMNFERLDKMKGSYKTQAKEYMADFYGIANSLSMMLASFHKSEEEIENCITLYLVSVQSVFWIFNNSSDLLEENDWSKNTHPHPIVRMGYFFELIEDELLHSLEIFEKRGEFSFNMEKSEAVEKLMTNAYYSYANLVQSSNVLLPINTLLSDKCDNEIVEIKKAAHEIKEYFRDAAFVKYK